MGRFLKILKVVLAALAAVICLVYLLVQAPFVQTFLTEKISSILFDGKPVEVSVGKVHIKSLNKLMVRDLVLVDTEPFFVPEDSLDRIAVPYRRIDTLAHVGYMSARFSIAGLFHKDGVYLKKVLIKDTDFNLVVEPNWMCNIKRMFASEEKKEKKSGAVFEADKVIIDDLRFNMVSYRPQKKDYKGGVNWSDASFRMKELKVRGLSLDDGIFSGKITSGVFAEKNGFHCNSLEADVTVRAGLVEIVDFGFTDSYSHLHLPYYSMSYSRGISFRHFTREVSLDIQFEDAYVHSRTLASLVPGFSRFDAAVFVDGRFSGPVNSFSVDKLSVRSGDFSLAMDGSVRRILSPQDAFLAVKRLEINSTTAVTDSILHQIPSTKNVNLSALLPGAKLHVQASADGTFEKLNLKASTDAGAGRISAVVDVNHLLKGKSPMSIHGKLWSDNLDVGKLRNSDKIGTLSFTSAITAHFPKDSAAFVNLDSLVVNKLNVLGKEYSRIAAVGKLRNSSFSGSIVSQDPDCNFILQGAFSVSPRTQNKVYKFYANVGHADLHAMNIDKREVSNISFWTNVDFTKTSRGDILGDMYFNNMIFENEEKKHDLGTVTITSHSNDNIYRARLNSSFAQASFIGSASIVSFISDLNSVTLKRELPSLFSNPEYQWLGNDYTLTLKCINTAELMSYIKPGLFLDNKTTLTASLSSSGELSAKLKSKRLANKGNYLKDIDLNIDNRGDSLHLDFNCGEIMAGSASLKNNNIRMTASKDTLSLGYSFDNVTDLANTGNLTASAVVSRIDDKVRAAMRIDPSHFTLNSTKWNIGRTFAQISNDGIYVDSLRLESGNQRVLLDGGFSHVFADTLSLKVKALDLSNLNSFFENRDLNLAGFFSGSGSIYSEKSASSFEANFIADRVSLAGTALGDISLKASRDIENGRVIVDAHNELAGLESFRLSGNYMPSERKIDLSADLDRFNVSVFKPFLTTVFSDIEGKLSGIINLSGNVRKLNLSSSNGHLDGGRLDVEFTGVPYTVNGPFHLDNSGIWFDNMDVTDNSGNVGHLGGGIRHQRLKNMYFDAGISFTGLKLIDIPYDQGKGIYGSASGTGEFRIDGPLKNLVLTLDLGRTDGGRLHIPINNGSKIEKTELLRFKEPPSDKEVDLYEEMMKKTYVKASSNLLVRVNAYAGQNVEALLEIDKANGNVIAARGDGLIKLNIGKGIFDIKGDYVINSGSYRFVALGVASRDFSIRSGSTIKFNGSVMDSSLDIDAVWKTKTSISTLIADTTSVSGRNTVNCGINISDRLSNPYLSFSIDVADLEPSVKSRVESALNTEDKVQKQFLSLILSNSFIPDEQSGIFNNQSVLYSNMSEIMAGQLNNILQKLEIPVDLGLKYLPGKNGAGIFDVAVSTQLFNNRVVVNGNFGNRQYNSSGRTDVVGDLDIEVKLDKNGTVRLTVFSHSADKYTNYLDNSQRNGVGITYQRDFNSFRDLLKFVFSGKGGKGSFRDYEFQKVLNQGNKTIVIESLF